MSLGHEFVLQDPSLKRLIGTCRADRSFSCLFSVPMPIAGASPSTDSSPSIISLVSQFLRVIEITVHTAGKTVAREALSYCAWSAPIWRQLLILLLGTLF